MSAPAVERSAPVRVDFSDPRRRRRRLMRIIGLIVIVIALAATVWLVWFSAVLSVSIVRVVGVGGDRAATIQRAAGIPTGVPLARVDTDAAQRRVLALPWVASADVRRGWPSEIVVAVTARQPIAVVSADGKRSAVDADGVSFAPPEAMPKDLPTVTAKGDGLAAAMSVLASLPADLARRVVSLDATTLDDVTLTLRSGDTVRWGSAEQPEFKAEVLRALMNRKADVYDVTAPELPTTFRARS
jgi:cell division protein FtsQ